jgi:hypothetical protein
MSLQKFQRLYAEWSILEPRTWFRPRVNQVQVQRYSNAVLNDFTAICGRLEDNEIEGGHQPTWA